MAIKRTAGILLRVAVVDDEEDTRLYFQDILQEAEDFRFAGGFANATDAINDIPCLQPDLVLMDIQLPDLNGIECTKRLKGAIPHLKIVIITGRHDENSVQRSFEAGADGYLIKPITADQCLATLRFAAVSGAKIKPPSEKSKAACSLPSLPKTCLPLSPRETEVLRRLSEGLLYKEIAEEMRISFSAVHKHQNNIFRKLHVMNRTEAIFKWHNSKTEPPERL